jgi:MarR family transcriptional regulator, organic hydroperoxide resistance regulator
VKREGRRGEMDVARLQEPCGWTEVGFELWRAGVRWRRSIDAALKPLGLAHSDYIVLRATHDLERRSGDAICQNEVAAHTDMRKMITSKLMRRLEQRGLVSRGPSANGVAWRVFVTQKGRKALRESVERIAGPSAALFLHVSVDESALRAVLRRIGVGV